MMMARVAASTTKTKLFIARDFPELSFRLLKCSSETESNYKAPNVIYGFIFILINHHNYIKHKKRWNSEKKIKPVRSGFKP